MARRDKKVYFRGTQVVKIDGVVVLYNPENEILDNINKYRSFLDHLYVVDNSNQVNEELVKKVQEYKNVKYIPLNGNKGIGKALNVEKTINSPTFTIMKCYKGKYPLYHLDLYRLNGVNQEFDLEEYIDSGIAVIEWPHQADELLPKEYLRIIITIDNDKRKFEFIPVGEKYEKLMEVAKFE